MKLLEWVVVSLLSAMISSAWVTLVFRIPSKLERIAKIVECEHNCEYDLNFKAHADRDGDILITIDPANCDCKKGSE